MLSKEETYSISQVAEYTGFKPHVIRFYEKEFNLNIPRSENARRYFTKKEINLFLYIKSLQEKGSSNKEIKKLLKSKDINMEEDFNKINGISEVEDQNHANDLDEGIISTESFHINSKDEIIAVLEQYNYKNEIEKLKEKVEELLLQLSGSDKMKDKDILICENAKLKLKVKEKSYEVAELKDRLKQIETQRTSIFSRIFKPMKKQKSLL